MDLIRVLNVTKQYKNGVTAIQDLNLSVKKGDFIFLIGGSGSGKSTLIKMIYREEKPTFGEIIVGGLNVAKLRNAKVYKIRRKLGIVFQDFRLLEKRTVYENVAFALECLGDNKDKIREMTLKALELVGLKGKIHNFPTQLSGGEQQRVAIARAIVNEPKLLICDEPTGNLDPERSKEIMQILEQVNKELNTTIIVATHDREIVDQMNKRVIMLEEGRLVKDEEHAKYDKVDKKKTTASKRRRVAE